MTSSPRRRADAFDAWLDGVLGESRTGTAEFEDLRPVVVALREHRPLDPSPEFVAGLREDLLERARLELAPDRLVAAHGRRAPKPARAARRGPGRDRWVAAGIAAAALTVASATGAVASRDALPGEALYPLKRAIEDSQVALQADDGDRGRSLLAHASDRLDELDRLAAAGSTDTSLVVSTVADFRDQADAGTSVLLRSYAADPRPETVDGVRAFAAAATDRLAGVRDALPTGADPAVEEALADLADLDARALGACATCSALPALAPPVPTSSEEPEDVLPDDEGATGAAPSGEEPTAASGRGDRDDPAPGASEGRADRRPGTGRTGGAAGPDRPGGRPTGEIPTVGGAAGAPGTGGDSGLVEGARRGLQGPTGVIGGSRGTTGGGAGNASGGRGVGGVLDGVVDDLDQGLGRGLGG